MDHHCTFCVGVTNVSPEEAHWLVEQLEPVSLTLGGAIADDEDTLVLPIRLPGHARPKRRRRFLAESDSALDPFHHHVQRDDADDNRAGFGAYWQPDGSLEICGDGRGNDSPEVAAYFIRKFLHEFRKDESFGITYAVMDLREPYGGAFFITASSIDHMDAFTWLKERSERFKEA